ncbi:hypothetical protein NC653_018700 [Populus alba x Populus x berolinensis]|uniref:Uncharacterized protein n=2 Tax=Populus TaxID=3689 RepID=A0A4U5QSU8_POPAL|nr:hypothetical protein NC653_018700 [Populus alba x Populus x berolinensis]TKS13631.1 hypothetical protein D5086_0000051250 [Populus alba]
MSRCYLGDPKDSRPLRTKCFSTYDDDIDKALLLVEDFNNDLDVIDDEIDAIKGTKMGVDVVGSDVRCSGIGPNMRDEMSAEIGVEVGYEMEKEMSFKMGIDIDIGVDAKFEMESNDDNDKIDDD